MSDRSTLTISTIEKTPIGAVRLAFSPLGLFAVEIDHDDAIFRQTLTQRLPNATIQLEESPYMQQVRDYFAGKSREFDMPIDWAEMTLFNRSALQQVMKIPAGRTKTYGQIAAELGQTNGARAVGGANASNPMPLIVPCHRVIGANGRLHGYSAANGISTKAWLLKHEGVSIAFQPKLI